MKKRRNKSPESAPRRMGWREAFTFRGVAQAVPVVLGMTASAFANRLVGARMNLGTIPQTLFGLVSASVMGAFAAMVAPGSGAAFTAGATANVLSDVIAKLRGGRMAAPSAGDGELQIEEKVTGQPVLSMTV